MAGLFDIVGPLIRLADAEKAHHIAIKALKSGVIPVPKQFSHSKLESRILGLCFPNPIGLAPGFDKNGEVPKAMLARGFGYVEIGTVTPLSQEGNAKPRLFRLSDDRGIINRMGFNNDGLEKVLSRLAIPVNGIVGVNIGANKDSADRHMDYVKGLKAFQGIADYLTVNISSPNTPGLRALQGQNELVDLLGKLNQERRNLNSSTPMLLKIAPDLADNELGDICKTCLSGAVDGLIISNTTLSRENLTSAARHEAGGLSGEPLFAASTRMLAKAYDLTDGKLPLIGVGGVSSGEQAFAKVCAGASLVQLYSAMVFQGPDIAKKISIGLVKQLEKHNFKSIKQATGSNVSAWLK